MAARQRTLDVLDAIRFRHNPATDWDEFFDALWEKRSTIRDDPDSP